MASLWAHSIQGNSSKCPFSHIITNIAGSSSYLHSSHLKVRLPSGGAFLCLCSRRHLLLEHTPHTGNDLQETALDFPTERGIRK